MSAAPVNWDDVPVRQVAVGPIEGAWRDLGTAAGTRRLGLRRVADRARQALDAGAHAQRRGGSVLRPRRLRAQLAGRRDLRGRRRRLPRAPHRGAGPHPRRRPRRPRRARLQRAHRVGGLLPAARQGRRGSAAAGSRPATRRTRSPRRRRPATSSCRREPSERPAGIVNVDDVPAAGGRARRLRLDSPRPRRRGRRAAHRAAAVRPLARQARHAAALPQRRRGALRRPRGRRRCTSSRRAGATGWDPEERPVKAGDVVGCLAGTGVAHAFRAGPARPHLPRLRQPRHQRHDLVPALAEDRVPRARRDRPRRAHRSYWDGEE